MLTSNVSLQLSMDDFINEDEMREWAERKWDAAFDAEHPPLEDHNSWRLTERWFSVDEGRSRTNKTPLHEELSKTRDNMMAGLALMNVDDSNIKDNKKGPEQKPPSRCLGSCSCN